MTKEALYIDAATRCAEITYWKIPSCSGVLGKGGEEREREQQTRTFQRKVTLQQNVLWLPPWPHDSLEPFTIAVLLIIQEQILASRHPFKIKTPGTPDCKCIRGAS